MPRPKPNGFMAAMADLDTWADEASCIGEDPGLFDTIMANKHTAVTLDTQVAMDICADCPVMMQCLENAIRFDARDVVMGGMVYEERIEWALRHHPEWLPARVLRDLELEQQELAA